MSTHPLSDASSSPRFPCSTAWLSDFDPACKELTMTSVRPDVRDFFRRYQSAGEDLDNEALASLFSGVFMSLDANSATAVSPQALLAALPRRKQLFEAIGSDGLELTDISE